MSEINLEAACFKCKKKRPFNFEKAEIKKTTKGDKGLVYGFCSVCNHKVCKIVSASDVIKYNQAGGEIVG